MSDLAERILQPPMVRTNVNAIIATMEDHHARGVPISTELARAVPIIAGQLMQHKAARFRAIGAKLVLWALKHNLDVYQFADKAARLDAGQSTENVDHRHAVIIKGISEGDV